MNFKMNKKAKKAWLAALRSGKIKQANGILRDTKNGRCCLGVLCDVFKRLTGRGRWRRDADGEWVFRVDDEHAVSTLPDAVAEWAT